MWNLLDWKEQILNELKNNGTKNIIEIGASNPKKWEGASGEDLPGHIYWSWLVLHKDSDVDETEREYYHESEKAKAEVQEIVNEAVLEYDEYLEQCA